MGKRVQYRVQLAFKPDQDHLRVYKYLKNLPDKTDYIVRLVLADLSGGKQNIVSAGNEAPPPAPAKIDYDLLLEKLRPALSGMVNDVLRNTLLGGLAQPATPAPSASISSTSAPVVATTSSEPVQEANDESLDLAMEGLEAFGV